MEGDALLLGEAHRRACRLADSVVGHGLRRTGHFAHYVRLLTRQVLRPDRQPPRSAKGLHHDAASEAFPRQQFLEVNLQIVCGLGNHPPWNFFAADLEQKLQSFFGRGSCYRRPWFLLRRRAHARTSRRSVASPLCSRYADAVRQAMPRTRAIKAARSVVEITPRASIKLNRCEHFKQ